MATEWLHPLFEAGLDEFIQTAVGHFLRIGFFLVLWPQIHDWAAIQE
jgi:hypothetical protein